MSGTRRIYIGFNQKDMFANTPGGKAIQDARVRRALQYAVDVPTICEQLLNTTCTRATGLVNPPNAHPDLKPYPYDPKMAEKLLDEAGYPKKDGVRFEITLQAPNGRYLNDKNVALAVGQYPHRHRREDQGRVDGVGFGLYAAHPQEGGRSDVPPWKRRGHLECSLRHGRPLSA